MSGTYLLTGGTADDISIKLTTNTVTVIAGDAQYETVIYWVQATEIAGATPTITFEKYDAANAVSYYIRKSAALTANGFLLFSEGIKLNRNWFLRATASAANQIDVVGIKGLVNTIQ